MLHMKSESGRSLLETLGVLAVLGLVTIGGITGFNMLTTETASKNILDRVLDAAIFRSHDFLSGRMPKAANRVAFDNAPVPLTVENGIDGAFEGLFWVTLGEGQATVSNKVCEQLLKEKEKLQNAQLSLVDISINGAMTSTCSESNTMRFFFKKNSKTSASSSSISVTPKITNDDDTTTDCPKITCPNHANCSENTVTCVPGYRKTGCNTCTPSCVACPDGTYQANDTSDCDTTCDSCGDAQVATNDHTACRDLEPGTPCPNGGYAGGPGDPVCYDCLQNSHCNEGYICDETHTCQPAPIGDTSHCQDGLMADGNGHCVVCTSDTDCGICKECAPDRMSCTTITNAHDSQGNLCSSEGESVECLSKDHCGDCNECSNNKCEQVTNNYDSANNVCDADGNKVACLAPYGSGQTGACQTIELPQCISGACEACPDSAHLWNNTTHQCYCPAHATCSGGQIHCNAGFYLNGSTCSVCEGNTYSMGNATSCTSCGTATANTDHTGCTSNCSTYQEFVDGTYRCMTGFTNINGCCACQSGKWLSGSTCPNCPTNATCSGVNSTTFTCAAGYEKNANGNGCRACSNNTISKAGGTCVDCGAGTANSTHTDCTPNSNAIKNENTLICSVCPAGQYKNGSSCSACSGARQYSVAGATSCSTCGAGKKANTAHTGCVNCSSGATDCGCTDGKVANGSGSCHCPSGKWLNGSTCQNCPTNGVCTSANTKSPCTNFKFAHLSNGVCVQCTATSHCTAGLSATSAICPQERNPADSKNRFWVQGRGGWNISTSGYVIQDAGYPKCNTSTKRCWVQVGGGGDKPKCRSGFSYQEGLNSGYRANCYCTKTNGATS